MIYLAEISANVDMTIPIWSVISGIVLGGAALIRWIYSINGRLKSVEEAKGTENVKEDLQKEIEEAKNVALAKMKLAKEDLENKIANVKELTQRNDNADEKQENRINEIAQGLVRAETEISNIKDKLK